jgi:hypothetical protein
MIALVALALATPPQAALPAENDIVIIGQRVRKVKFRIKLDKAGRTVCRITRTSGDPEIDGLACDTARPCVRPDIVTKAAMTACLEPRWAQLPAQIAARRRARIESDVNGPN